jgi:pentapeptide MXKDX repeat protein
MKKTILVATCVAALSAFATPGAFEQGTGPAPQQDTVSKDKMAKNDMKKEGMGTTGMKKDSMGKDGISKEGFAGG